MKMALDMLVEPHPHIRTSFTDSIKYREKINQVIETLRQALAQPEQEPVAWIGNADFVKGQFVEGRVRRVWWECNTGVGQLLYTAPPKREWAGLTDDDMHTIRDDAFVKNVDDIEWALQMARRIEAKLKERNT